ncbi:glycosyltransferase family 9 protein [Babesia caballi]|uniref:Glycosyltransferase family 9 protein n=1 Tax=Babesia caballi TaxID=5871 RepID=A0AAV4LNW1_BABCB|nr:glycosyltransferase family 9 protein [Babesia caballi]
MGVCNSSLNSTEYKSQPPAASDAPLASLGTPVLLVGSESASAGTAAGRPAAPLAPFDLAALAGWGAADSAAEVVVQIVDADAAAAAPYQVVGALCQRVAVHLVRQLVQQRRRRQTAIVGLLGAGGGLAREQVYDTHRTRLTRWGAVRLRRLCRVRVGDDAALEAVRLRAPRERPADLALQLQRPAERHETLGDHAIVHVRLHARDVLQQDGAVGVLEVGIQHYAVLPFVQNL